MANRGYKIKSTENFYNYFINEGITGYKGARFKEHDSEYLIICYYNLREKYLRGQKDFTKEVWDKLKYFVRKELE